jgi:hypothetical protein
LRSQTPIESHAEWSPAPARQPVDLVEGQNEDRLPWLAPVRRARMVVSPFTFYRGGARIMAADLASTPVSGLRTQICGDAHLANFGFYASPERRLVFDLNDFDETLAGPWEWDVNALPPASSSPGGTMVSRRSNAESSRGSVSAPTPGQCPSSRRCA